MRKKNAGFTLTELLVILALMAVIGGFLAWSSASIFGFGARECHKKLATAISTTKIDTLSKSKEVGDVYLEITRNNKGSVFIEEFINGESQGKTKIAKSRVNIEYKNEGGASTYTAIGDSPYVICFNRSNGALVNKSTKADSTLQYIRIGSGIHTYTITVWPKTGKISYKL